jgi:hypothetical protein
VEDPGSRTSLGHRRGLLVAPNLGQKILNTYRNSCDLVSDLVSYSCAVSLLSCGLLCLAATPMPDLSWWNFVSLRTTPYEVLRT